MPSRWRRSGSWVAAWGSPNTRVRVRPRRCGSANCGSANSTRHPTTCDVRPARATYERATAAVFAGPLASTFGPQQPCRAFRHRRGRGAGASAERVRHPRASLAPLTPARHDESTRPRGGRTRRDSAPTPEKATPAGRTAVLGAADWGAAKRRPASPAAHQLDNGRGYACGRAAGGVMSGACREVAPQATSPGIGCGCSIHRSNLPRRARVTG